MERYTPPEARMEMKDFSTEVKDIFDNYINKLGIKDLVELQMKNEPLVGGSPGQLTERWSKDKKSVVAIYEPVNQQERKELQKGLNFLIGHELMHNFDEIAETILKPLSDTENEESFELEQMNNPLFISGQTETFVDFAVLRNFSETNEDKKKILSGYEWFISDLLKQQTLFLRDEIRALFIVKIMPKFNIVLSHELQAKTEQLKIRIEKQIELSTDLDKKYVELYKIRLAEFLDDCLNIPDDDWQRLMKSQIPL